MQGTMQNSMIVIFMIALRETVTITQLIPRPRQNESLFTIVWQYRTVEIALTSKFSTFAGPHYRLHRFLWNSARTTAVQLATRTEDVLLYHSGPSSLCVFFKKVLNNHVKTHVIVTVSTPHGSSLYFTEPLYLVLVCIFRQQWPRIGDLT